MADIFLEFTVQALPNHVFEAITTPAGLDCWWTRSTKGNPVSNGEYELFFGPGYDWRGKVTRFAPGKAFELQMTLAHPDWMGTRVGCELQPEGSNATVVRFYHTGWPDANQHWRVSCYCWAMYLRLLRRYVEHGEFVPYEKRLEV